jgi:hypothetical protein
MGVESISALPMKAAFGLCTLLISAAIAVSILQSSKGRAILDERTRSRNYVLVGLLLLALAVIGGATSTNWPSPLVVCAFTSAGAASGFLLHFPLDWVADRFKTRSQGEMAGHFVGLVGVLYAIVLGFVVVTAWEQFNRSDELSINEQYDAYDLFNTIRFYDYDNRQGAQVRGILSSLSLYADGMANEGHQMSQSQPLYSSTGAPYSEPDRNCSLPSPEPRPGPTPTKLSSIINDQTMVALRCRILQLKPTTLRDQAVYASSMRFLTDLSDVRNTRRHHYIKPPLQPEMWTAFVVGAFILVGMLYLVETRSRGQKVRAMAVGSIIGLMWGLALIFNHPFNGSSSINYPPWCRIEKGFVNEEGPEPAPTPSAFCTPSPRH